MHTVSMTLPIEKMYYTLKKCFIGKSKGNCVRPRVRVCVRVCVCVDVCSSSRLMQNRSVAKILLIIRRYFLGKSKNEMGSG